MRDLVLLAAVAGCSFTGASVGPGDAARGDAPPAVDAALSTDGATNDGATMADATTQPDASTPPTCTTTYPMGSPAGHHYKVLANKTWDEGVAGCVDMGHLVKIESSAENQYVAGLASGFYWIGLKDIAGNDVYKWTDGSGLTFNGFGGSPPTSPDDCVDSDGTGRWTPYSCGTREAAICECE